MTPSAVSPAPRRPRKPMTLETLKAGAHSVGMLVSNRRNSRMEVMMRIPRTLGSLVAVFVALVPAVASAEPTDIVVRVLSKDAKFVGTSMGGVRITLRDLETGETLAMGVTEGSTGDTQRLMHENGGRRAQLSDPSAAKYQVTLDLDRPRLIEVEAYGPLAQRQSAQRVTSAQWVIPGRGITGGDGWVLELPGFVVDVLGPPAHARVGVGVSVDVRANVITMCGCPVEPKGLWDADKYEVAAIVSLNGMQVSQVPLAFAGETSQFAASIPVEAPGFYDVLVYAYDPASGNTGLDRTTFIASK